MPDLGHALPSMKVGLLPKKAHAIHKQSNKEESQLQGVANA